MFRRPRKSNHFKCLFSGKNYEIWAEKSPSETKIQTTYHENRQKIMYFSRFSVVLFGVYLRDYLCYCHVFEWFGKFKWQRSVFSQNCFGKYSGKHQENLGNRQGKSMENILLLWKNSWNSKISKLTFCRSSGFVLESFSHVINNRSDVFIEWKQFHFYALAQKQHLTKI